VCVPNQGAVCSPADLHIHYGVCTVSAMREADNVSVLPGHWCPLDEPGWVLRLAGEAECGGVVAGEVLGERNQVRAGNPRFAGGHLEARRALPRGQHANFPAHVAVEVEGGPFGSGERVHKGPSGREPERVHDHLGDATKMIQSTNHIARSDKMVFDASGISGFGEPSGGGTRGDHQSELGTGDTGDGTSKPPCNGENPNPVRGRVRAEPSAVPALHYPKSTQAQGKAPPHNLSTISNSSLLSRLRAELASMTAERDAWRCAAEMGAAQAKAIAGLVGMLDRVRTGDKSGVYSPDNSHMPLNRAVGPCTDEAMLRLAPTEGSARIADLVEAFMDDKTLGGNATGYIKGQRKELLNVAASNNWQRASDITVDSCRLWMHRLHTEGKKSKTVKNYRDTLSRFCDYLVKRGLLPSNPVLSLPVPKVVKSRARIVPTDDEVRRIILASLKEWRTLDLPYALELLAVSGLRASEAYWLQVDMVADDPAQNWLDLPAWLTKPKREERAYLSPSCHANLRALKAERTAVVAAATAKAMKIADPTKREMAMRRAKRLFRTGLKRGQVKTYARKAEPPVPTELGGQTLSYHSFRHFAADRLGRLGFSMDEARWAMRHTPQGLTATVYNFSLHNKVAESFRRIPPLCRELAISHDSSGPLDLTKVGRLPDTCGAEAETDMQTAYPHNTTPNGPLGGATLPPASALMVCKDERAAGSRGESGDGRQDQGTSVAGSESPRASLRGQTRGGQGGERSGQGTRDRSGANGSGGEGSTARGHKQGVAQLGRASGLGPEGRAFKSHHPDCDPPTNTTGSGHRSSLHGGSAPNTANKGRTEPVRNLSGSLVQMRRPTWDAHSGPDDLNPPNNPEQSHGSDQDLPRVRQGEAMRGHRLPAHPPAVGLDGASPQDRAARKPEYEGQGLPAILSVAPSVIAGGCGERSGPTFSTTPASRESGGQDQGHRSGLPLGVVATGGAQRVTTSQVTPDPRSDTHPTVPSRDGGGFPTNQETTPHGNPAGSEAPRVPHHGDGELVGSPQQRGRPAVLRGEQHGGGDGQRGIRGDAGHGGPGSLLRVGVHADPLISLAPLPAPPTAQGGFTHGAASGDSPVTTEGTPSDRTARTYAATAWATSPEATAGIQPGRPTSSPLDAAEQENADGYTSEPQRSGAQGPAEHARVRDAREPQADRAVAPQGSDLPACGSEGSGSRPHSASTGGRSDGTAHSLYQLERLRIDRDLIALAREIIGRVGDNPLRILGWLVPPAGIAAGVLWLFAQAEALERPVEATALCHLVPQ
jgi:site-specific recombinase XerC